jgi:hypothetical protein
MSEQCPDCKKYPLYPNVHKCHPFEVGIPWRGEVHDWQPWHGIDAAAVAIDFAEKSDSQGDYTIIRNGGGEIWVRDSSGAITKFDIEAESVPHYYARQRAVLSGEGVT